MLKILWSKQGYRIIVLWYKGPSRQNKQCGLVVNIMGFRSEGFTFLPEQ